MIVCLCECVSESQIRHAVDKGAFSVEQVGNHCGAGTGCGGCHSTIESILEESAERTTGNAALPLVCAKALA